MRPQPGHVALVRFPQADLQQGKYRPVLLLAQLPGPFNDWLVCAITSQLRHAVANWDEIVEVTDVDFDESGLKERSVIRTGKLATLEETMIAGVLGEISSQRLSAILSKIADFLEHPV
jgi:mRNA interferase MazF